MDESEADKAAILAAIRGETEAWLQRDFEAMASHWVQSPQTRRMEAFASLGIRVDQGWDAIATRLKKIVERFPEKQPFEERVSWENVNVIVAADMAWVTYDQIGTDTGDDLKRLLKIMHRVDGVWKIACLVMMESTVQQANCPLIEIDAEARVLWTNHLARERMRGHEGLVVAAGRLRARHRECDAALRDAVRLAFEELQSQRPLAVAPKQTWAVALGENTNGVPLYCWVLLEDGKALVSFENAETVERRIAGAQEVYRLSPAPAPPTFFPLASIRCARSSSAFSTRPACAPRLLWCVHYSALMRRTSKTTMASRVTPSPKTWHPPRQNGRQLSAQSGVCVGYQASDFHR